MAQGLAPSPVSPPPEAIRKGISTVVFVAVVVIVAIAASVGGIYVGKTVYGSSSKAQQFLTVGTNVPFPPFESYNVTTNTYYGFDIDFAGMIANATHRTLVVVNYADFTDLLLSVGSGGVDMAASGITESGATGALRNQTMSFSIPYYSANQAVLVQSSSTLACAMGNCSVHDLAPLVVGLQTGTTSDSWATQYLQGNETGHGSIQRYTTVDTEVTALEAGTLDAIIIDQGPASAIAAASAGKLKVAGAIITDELYGFAVAHGDPEGLLPVINNVIKQAMSDGTYQKLITKWFK